MTIVKFSLLILVMSYWHLRYYLECSKIVRKHSINHLRLSCFDHKLMENILQGPLENVYSHTMLSKAQTDPRLERRIVRTINKETKVISKLVKNWEEEVVIFKQTSIKRLGNSRFKFAISSSKPTAVWWLLGFLKFNYITKINLRKINLTKLKYKIKESKFNLRHTGCWNGMTS